MKPSPRDWLIWLCALAMSLVLLTVARTSRAQLLQPRDGEKATISIPLSFGDFGHRRPSISCGISAAGHLREVHSVGFTYAQRAIWLSQRMYEQAKLELPGINSELAVFGCSANVFPSASIPAGKDWFIDKSFDCSSSNRGFAEAARASLAAWMNHLDGEKGRMLDDFYRSRSIRASQGPPNGRSHFYIDYAAVVQRATPILANCAAALIKEHGPDVNFLTSLLQELPYVKLDGHEGEVHIHDFWVPTQVLVEKRGDCDSKSAAFCSLWRNYSKDVIMFLSNRHALVGVRAPPTTTLPTKIVKGIPYVQCDVSGLYNERCGNVPADNYRPFFVDD